MQALRAFLRRRSALELAVLVSFFARASFGWTVALPLISLLVSSGLGALPEGDRALFEPGGLWLLETLRKLGPSLGAHARSELVLFGLASAVGIVPHALVFVACAERGVRFEAAFSRALRAMPRFALILLVELVICAVSWFLAAFASGLWSESAPGALTEPLRDLSTLGVLALGFVAAGAIGVLADLTRAASCREPRPPLGVAVRAAISALKQHGSTLASGVVLFTGLGGLLVALTARAVEWLDVSQPGATRVLAVFALHQTTLLGLALLQAIWILRVSAELGRADLFRRGSARPEAVDRSEHSAAPVGPSSDLGA